MRIRLTAVAVTLAVCLFEFAPAASGQSGQTGTLRVFASNGVKSVLEALEADAQRAAGRPLTVQYGTSASLVQRIEAGEAFDVAMMTSDSIDALVKQGRLAAGSRASLGRSGLGVGIRTGAPKPDLSSPDALKRTLLAARALTYAQDGASRVYIVKMFEALGIAEQIKGKTLLEQGSVRATARVVGGDADLVLTLVSEILPVEGLALAGTLPAQYQSYVSFAAGVSAKAGNPKAAQALIAFLSSASVAPTLSAKGIER